MKILCVIVGVVMTVSVARAGPLDDVSTTLDAFHRAAAEADYAAYVALMSDSIVFLGTDSSERWQGRAFREFAAPHFEQGDGWTYVPGQRNISLSVDGHTAWFDESLANAQLGQCRGSGVLVLEEGNWRIAQYNLSVPVPNALVEDLVSAIAAHESGDESAPMLDTQSAGSDPEVESEPAQEPSGTTCKRRRHKTNRPADC